MEQSLPVLRAITTHRARRFQAFGVGLPKTGTTSVGTIFGNYRSAKFRGDGMKQLACDVREGKLPEEELAAFVLRRDAEEWLEIDASSGNWLFIHALTEHFPSARFILTIRDCYSWMDSLINVLIGRDISVEFVGHAELFRQLGGCEMGLFRDVETVLANHLVIFENLLEMWSQQTMTVLACPPSRTLVVRTNEISSSVTQMADFVGVPPETLLVDRSHSRQTVEKFEILRKLDRAFLLGAFGKYASSNFMQEYFPSFSLDSFLDRPVQAVTPPRPTARWSAEDIAPLCEESRGLYPIGYWINQADSAAANDRFDLVPHLLAMLPERGLEPDEVRRVEDVRVRVAAARAAATPSQPTIAAATSPAMVVAPTTLEVLKVARAFAARGLPQQFGHHLDEQSTRPTNDGRRALLVFVNAPRRLVLEVGLRDAAEGHWVASERFAISYQHDAPPKVLADLDLAKLLLAALERHVRRSESNE